MRTSWLVADFSRVESATDIDTPEYMLAESAVQTDPVRLVPTEHRPSAATALTSTQDTDKPEGIILNFTAFWNPVSMNHISIISKLIVDVYSCIMNGKNSIMWMAWRKTAIITRRWRLHWSYHAQLPLFCFERCISCIVTDELEHNYKLRKWIKSLYFCRHDEYDIAPCSEYNSP